MNFLTDRKRAHGLGSGRHGTHHHWQMLISSSLLVILIPLFVITFACALGGTFAEVQAFYARPLPAIITALTLLVGMWHLNAEAPAAIEDYMHGTAQKLTMVAVTAFSYTVMTVGVFAVARMAL